MDPQVQSLLERTRQRRVMLNQKLGMTPDAAPRKRTLGENTSHNVATPQVDDDDSPKRKRVSGEERKPDTPAIAGVKSRMQKLTEQRTYTAGDTTQEPVDMDQKRVTMPTPGSPVNRKSRFANLARNINNWEDDLSHVTIQKEVEKKPRWQPPKKEESAVQKAGDVDAKDRHVSSPKKEYELYQGPRRTVVEERERFGSAPSPKTKEAPPPPPAPPAPTDIGGPPKPPRCASPVRVQSPKKYQAPAPPSASPVRAVNSPRFQHQVKKKFDQVPVNVRGLNDTVDDGLTEEPTAKPINERMATWKKSVDTPTKDKGNDLPISSRTSQWEPKTSGTPGKVTSTKIVPPLKQVCEPPVTPNTAAASSGESDPSAKPVSDIRAKWQNKDADANPPKNEEPTAYSVGARMSAWEVISSNNQVSSIKKVDPGSPKGSPIRPVSFNPKATPPKSGLGPQKSFKDSIEERASQLRKGTATPSCSGLPPKPTPTPTSQSPTRKPSVHKSPMRTGSMSPRQGSPVKVGSATKSLQERLIQQTQHSKTDKLAEKIRRERMAEVNSLNNRYQNGIVRDTTTSESESDAPVTLRTAPSPNKTDRRDTIKAKARAEFDQKLASMGFEVSGENAAYSFNNQQQSQPANPMPPPAPAPPNQSTAQRKPSSAGNRPGSSIYRLVSKKCSEQERPVVRKESSSSLKKVTFKEASASGTESESDRCTDTGDEFYETDDFDPHSEETQSDTQESDLSSRSNESYESESSIPESYLEPEKDHNSGRQPAAPVQKHLMDDGDDVSLSAFVPASVRNASVMPTVPVPGSSASESSIDSEPHRGYGDRGRSTSNLRSLVPPSHEQSTDESDDEGDNDDIDDLLDEAMDDTCEVEMRHPRRNNGPVAAPRKRQSHMYATTDGELSLPMSGDKDGLAYSVSMYRSHRSTTIQTTVNFIQQSEAEYPEHCKRISRHSHYVHEDVQEEDIQMPKQLPPEVQEKTIKERIHELQELVSQEQSVIMQTSNALNQCCTQESRFAGSAEQVECNRLLLVACARRQVYLTEVQRLKDTRELEPLGQSGPKGSLTISDIRLPLKKDFVTKIGTAGDTTVHYFVILIKNGPQIILTQMLSTHDPMMRGSLDFPNLIKIHGISGQFKLNLEIYSMSVSREYSAKDKKKKTPKKFRGTSLTLESPGGPSAVRTTSFALITTLPLTMKGLDKNSFTLERVSYNSPLHGTIYMRLKCMMEQNVEERGFLTMFEDVSGLGSWHRRWCVLQGNKLSFWKYPDDENRKDPMGFVDLKRCITEKVGLIPRDICARPHTFEMASIRPPRRGEQDTLVSKTYNTMTTVRHMLSADTKEERIVWCNKVNRALANIRTWHADAMRPIRARKN